MVDSVKAREGRKTMSRMTPGSMPKPSEQVKAAFSKLVPGEPAVTLKPMFGNLAAFVNGNMFAGLFGEDLFVRLPDEDSAHVRKVGGRDFEPMPGHAMKGYVTVPNTWRAKPDAAVVWIRRALELTRKMPPKVPGAKKTAVKKRVAAK
jgi:TfoX/Sxy family transcriptional regulator of competence genes